MIELTGQDHYSGKSCNAFNQGDAVNLKSCVGPHKVLFKQDGQYRFTLRRYPAYTKLPFGAKTKKYTSKRLGTDFIPEKAEISVAGQSMTKKLKTEDASISFELKVQAGEADLETKITGMHEDKLKEIQAYFITTEFLGK